MRATTGRSAPVSSPRSAVRSGAQVWPEDIIVRDGIVHFWVSEDELSEKRQALRVAAETILGVRGVEEHTVPAPVIPAF